MAYKAQATAPVSHDVFATLQAGFKTFTAKAKFMLIQFQTAQMIACLSKMTDQQLEQIGVSRAEIPEYAQRLMTPGRD